MKTPSSLLALLRRSTVVGALFTFAIGAYAASMTGSALGLKVEESKSKSVHIVANPTRKGTAPPPPKAPADGSAPKTPVVNKNAPIITQTSSDVVYTITVTNAGPIMAKGVIVQYTIYNLTSTMKKGEHDSVLEPITGTETVDVPASGKIEVETKAISNQDSTTKAKPGAGTAVTATSKQEIQGYIVTLKVENQIVRTLESTPGLKRRMDALLAPKK